jgi:hypothetical protein
MAVGNSNNAEPLDGNYKPVGGGLVAPGTGYVMPQAGKDILTDTITGQQYAPAVGKNVRSSFPTFAATKIGLVPASSPTDIFTITGGATVVVHVTHIEISGVTDSAVAVAADCQLVRRSTANSGGTSTNSPAIVPFDSADTAVATVLSYTANPTLGTLVGTARAALRAQKLMLTLGTYTATDFPPVAPIIWDFHDMQGKDIVLRGTGEVLAVNLNATSLVGTVSLNISIEWYETPL